MCGIFGASIPKSNNKIRQKLSVLAGVLAHSNDKRGGDSFGFYTDGCMTKGLGNISQANFKFINRFASSKVGIYHTRNATTGDVTVENAHPFEIGKIVGAHNGVVYNHLALSNEFRKVNVDSEHIFYHIDEEKSLDGIRAYGAIEYIYKDAPEEGVFIGKFNGGMLGIAQTEIGTIWSSDSQDLRLGLNLAGIKHKLYNIEQNKLYQVMEDKVYKVSDLKFGENYFTNSDLSQNWRTYQTADDNGSYTYKYCSHKDSWISIESWNRQFPNTGWTWNAEKKEWIQTNPTPKQPKSEDTDFTGGY